MNQQLKHKIAILYTALFVCANTFAQSADSLKQVGHEIDYEFQFRSGFSTGNFEQKIFNNRPFNFTPVFQATELNNFIFLNENSLYYGNIFINRNLSKLHFENSGAYEHFRQNLIYRANGFEINAGIGLLKQNSVLTPFAPNYSATFGTYMEYEINRWLSLYMHGQYLLPINKHIKQIIDPVTYMNPVFVQSEIGGGLLTKYKNIKADVGFKKMFDTNNGLSKPANSMNTKITIGF